MREICSKVFAILLIILVSCSPVMAQDQEDRAPKFPEAGRLSVGSGAHWAGMAGLNYVFVPEGSQFGATAGAGWSDVGDDQFGWNGGVVFRFLPEHGLFVSYGTAGIYGLEYAGETLYDRTSEGITVSFGSIPVDSFDFVWRVGAAFFNEDWVDDDVVFDLGIGVAF